ncbi:Alpha/Beta hydrolase protein [Aspergillus karnatakaensis]|uniref:Alpha/Beta hydrolase protein n=1 Tax=Aspergillus karnatakaensis TaxID=1810916 RepID=UPI003CCCB9F1
METFQRPFVTSLGNKGYVKGVTISDSSKKDLCHYFGGVRYALGPSARWRKAQKLPDTYSYGTKDQPFQCPGTTGTCPQPAFMNLSCSDWDEDCFQCNIWVPLGEPPKDGWPILFFIHGGFLQFGSPNIFSAAALLGETDFNAIVVMPAYRLGVFGFLSSSELAKDASSNEETCIGNHGFWDQRMALEWVRENISLFGGNKSEITIAGYSAGAHSVCYQLAYDLRLPTDHSLVKRACIWSNSFTVPPKPLSTAEIQFNQLLSALNIPASAPDKLTRLRATPVSDLLAAAESIPIHEFRPTIDNTFIPANLFSTIIDGTFALQLSHRNIRLMIGECRDEHALYATWRPRSQNTKDSLRTRLLADYPNPTLVDSLMEKYYPDNTLPPGCANWNADAFGRIYADIQVHMMQRGFISSLATPSPASATGVSKQMERSIYRYRIEYRLKCAEKSIPLSWGVTHATDQYIWFWGNGEVVEEGEKPVISRAVMDPLIQFVHGEGDLEWGTKNHKEIRVLKPDGSVEIQQDGMWDEALGVWGVVKEISSGKRGSASRL